MTAHETAPPGDSDDSWSSTDAGEISQPDTRRRRILVPPVPGRAFWGWAGPILMAKVIPYSAWLSRMWFSNWI